MSMTPTRKDGYPGSSSAIPGKKKKGKRTPKPKYRVRTTTRVEIYSDRETFISLVGLLKRTYGYDNVRLEGKAIPFGSNQFVTTLIIERGER